MKLNRSMAFLASVVLTDPTALSPAYAGSRVELRSPRFPLAHSGDAPALPVSSRTRPRPIESAARADATRPIKR